MIREERFVQSHRPYAVDLGSLTTDGRSHATLDAVWFRRRAGRAVACIGKLWDVQRPLPTDAEQFLKQHDDGRYGGDCEARWDGERFWSSSQNPETVGRYLALLGPMLENHPDVPPGYTGWFVFEKRGRPDDRQTPAAR
jgi:hypothetical protein